MLLETGILSIDKPNYTNRKQLYLAALKDNLDTINLLIDYEIEIDIKDR